MTQLMLLPGAGTHLSRALMHQMHNQCRQRHNALLSKTLHAQHQQTTTTAPGAAAVQQATDGASKTTQHTRYQVTICACKAYLRHRRRRNHAQMGKKHAGYCWQLHAHQASAKARRTHIHKHVLTSSQQLVSMCLCMQRLLLRTI